MYLLAGFHAEEIWLGLGPMNRWMTVSFTLARTHTRASLCVPCVYLSVWSLCVVFPFEALELRKLTCWCCALAIRRGLESGLNLSVCVGVRKILNYACEGQCQVKITRQTWFFHAAKLREAVSQ